MSVCKNCGTQLKEDAKFCASCGTASGAETANTAIAMPAAQSQRQMSRAMNKASRRSIDPGSAKLPVRTPAKLPTCGAPNSLIRIRRFGRSSNDGNPRGRFLIVAVAASALLVGPMMGWQLPQADSARPVCSAGEIICVPQSVLNSLISNPFRIEITVNSSNTVEVNWEIDDGAGRTLDSSSRYEYNYTPNPGTSHGQPVQIQGFIFKPASSAIGTLILSARRQPIAQNDPPELELPGLRIPVRLTTATSMVTTLEPEDPGALKSAIDAWLGEPHHSSPRFDPRLKLVPHQIAIMQIEPHAIIGATAEAVLRSNPPWHAKDWRQEGSSAEIDIEGEGWAGSSFHWAEVKYLIEKSALNLPGISNASVYWPTP